MVLDFGMPGSNGAEVATSARQVVDDLRILFVSGYSDTSAIERAVGQTLLLHKPFLPCRVRRRRAIFARCPWEKLTGP